jgi:AbrB family looped-hinge helix DNA binding protein
MPWAKVLRSGQVTFPKEVREKLRLKEGDILDFEIGDAMVIVRPKVLMDRQTEGEKLWQIVEKMHAKMEGVAPEEIEQAIEESIREVRRRKKTKAAKAESG